MKLFLFVLILGIALQACGRPEFEQDSGRIRVEFRDGSVKEHHLLAVRKTSLLVGTKIHPEVLPISSMNRIFAENNAKTTWSIVGGLIGLSSVAVASSVVINKDGPNSGQGFLANNGVLWIFPPTILGAAIGYFLADDEDEFDPSNDEHLKELREVAAYPHGEPPELYNVK